MLFLFLGACSLVIAIGLRPVRVILRRRRALRRNWSEIVESIEQVNLEGIQQIAKLFLNPSKEQLGIEPSVIFDMLGGLEGLGRMQQNADAMLNLCIYAERWKFQGPLISELVRLDAVQLRKAVRRIEGRYWFTLGFVRSHFALLEAAAFYDLMRQRVLGQYEESHPGSLPLLKAKLGSLRVSYDWQANRGL